MEDISNITKQTLKNLSLLGLEATPAQYSKEFCKLSKRVNLSVKECEYFEYALSKISEDELKYSKSGKVETVYDLIDILLQRVEKKNIDKMSELFQNSLRPSISLVIDEQLNQFSIKIGDSPSLIFEESIQKEMEKFIENRFEVDKKVVAQKTADIARLITLMSKYLGDAIDSSSAGSSNVSDIKDEISAISFTSSTKEELNRLQTKLVQAAISIENEMSSVNQNLQTGQSEIIKLEQRVKSLEKELKETRKQNVKDHLTGTLNRKAYEEELSKIDEKYKRLNQNFAVIFFDLDYFKKVNDTYGHEGGDVVLKTFAALLLKLTRDIDIVGRYGGEEFVVAFHYKKEEELVSYLKRIKQVVSTNKFIYKENKLKVTFSAGVDLRGNKETLQETLISADQLLYKAKKSGRDKIVLWNGEEL